ncbi:PREDICTED: B(0,+)-type amino acid transporter 1-like [Elephantulus edwardii]|uniref:B(0,+)-type amino acid transporter 1-like n=1 Tax=Elephantulus edwardii TaxID=28737 RepID=UPI0003F0CE0B|nr:PREDICTED: B(0,+)-type amino acid transporter 1-like [Elephantulus edwardii]
MERSKERCGGEGLAEPKPGGGSRELRLRREIGLWSAVCLIAGCMIGSGIFMSPQGVLVYMGSPGASLVVWAVCGLLATLGALCYAELGALIPESGGEYAYILRTFGSLPAFLVIYTFVLVGRPAAIAAISLSFAEYVVAPFYLRCSSVPQVVVKGVAASSILLLMLVNCWSSRLATMLINVCTVAKVLSLLIVIGGGAVVLGQGRARTEALLHAFHNTTQQAGRIGIAFYQGLWSFDGWNSINYVTEELRNPQQNLVWALMIAIPLVTGLYILVNISYLLVLSPNEILSSDALAVSWGNQVIETWAWIVPLAVMLSTFGSVNGVFFSGSRVCYAAGREGHMPRLLSMVHLHCLTPAPALLFTATVALVLIILGNFITIVNFLSLTGWLTYGTTISCLLYLRMKEKNLPRPYKVPTVIPVIMLLASVYLVLAPIIDHPQMEFLYVFLFLVSGILVYFLFISFRCQPKCLKMATLHLQLLLEVAPATKSFD